MVLENFLIDVDVLWDRAGKELYEKPEARAGRKMRVRVTNKGLVEDLTGYTLNLGWKSTIDETKFGLDAFTAVDITKGIFELAYTSGMLTNIGTLVGTLQLVPTVGDATESNNFMITVKKSAVDAAAVQSETSFTALASALVSVNDWNARIDAVEADFIQRANDMEATYPQELVSISQQLEQTGEGLTKRIDNLVIPISPENANLEVTDSHVSVTKGQTYNSLTKRLEDNERDTHIGIENKIQNGNFENGTAGWTLYNSTASVLDNVLRVQASSNGASANVKQAVSFEGTNEKIIYIRAYARVTNADCITLHLFPGGTEISNPVMNRWYELEGYYSTSESNIEVMLDQRYENSTTANGKVMEVQYVLTSNITDTYGVGNEPSLEQLKADLSKFPNYWFDGRSSLFNGKTVVNAIANLKNEKADLAYLDDQLSAFEFEATNLISNGDFSNGKTDWSIYNAILTASDNILTVKNFTNGASSQARQTIPFPQSNQKRVYIRAYARVTNADCTLIRLLPNGTEISSPSIGEWYELETIVTATTSVQVALEQRYADTATATDKIMEVKYVLAVDLSDTFGIGKEPTIAEFNDLLSAFPNYWFDQSANLFNARQTILKLSALSGTTDPTSNELDGLTWGVLGDSITAFTNGYHKIIADKTGIEVTNYGENGRCIATRPGISAGLSEKYLNMADGYDIVTVFAGTNDARDVDPNGQIPLGTFADRATDTFYGACHVLYKGLIEKYPGKKLGVITPIQQDGNWGGSLESYAEASKEVAHYYSIPVLDLFHESGLNANIQIIKDRYVPDGLHPNAEGHKVLSRRIEMFIKSI